MLVVQAFMIPELSGSKCRYIQSFLQGLKSNALRLNEISCTDLLQMALLTFTRLVINRAHNINIHLSDTTPLPQSLYGVRSIKPPSSSQPSEDTVPLPVQLHLQGFCFSPLKVDAYSLVFSFPVQLQEVYHLIFLPYTVGIRFHDM